MKDVLANFHYMPDGSMTLADALCAFIKDEIAYGRLKAGETIPTIQNLAKASGLTFRVARGVVEQLAREGYVRSRPRVGTVVLPRDVNALRGRALFVLPDVDACSYHVTMIADALRRRLGAAGFAFSTVVFSHDGQIGLSFLKHELVRTPDVAIVIYGTPPVRKCLRDAGVKNVFIYGDPPKKDEGRWIRFSAEEAIANFAEHCVRAKVKRVTQVRFEGNETPDARRALADRGIACGWMTVPRMDGLGRYEGIERSAYNVFMNLPRASFPDVFLFWDDFVAQGALTAFLGRGLRIPGDVKVVSLSNRGLGPVYSEALTRIECDASEAGEKVAAFALSLLAKGRLPPPPAITPHYVFGRTFPY
ncbi:MAG: LacI family DNA-binding transcriptional regulator [Kiritimatiellae bacterium]|nr:LacI family DNA-binding transcriptional regulator [Kiritimatiellia bacterium]